MNRIRAVALLFFVIPNGCGSDESDPVDPLPTSAEGPAPFMPSEPYEPDIAVAALSADITNPLMPFPVGARWLYEADTDEGVERIEILVEEATREVWGATARVVRDTVTVEGELTEDTWDWYAQDSDGHVWYLGEDTQEYEDGQVVCECGAWESGVGGALPGVVMLAAPEVGDVYRQEYLAGEAEDVAEVVAVDETVTVAAGTFTGCLRTRDRSAIDPELDEYKVYCPGVGNVLVLEGDVRVELIESSGL